MTSELQILLVTEQASHKKKLNHWQKSIVSSLAKQVATSDKIPVLLSFTRSTYTDIACTCFAAQILLL